MNYDAIINSLLFIVSGLINQLGLGCLECEYSDGLSIYCYIKNTGKNEKIIISDEDFEDVINLLSDIIKKDVNINIEYKNKEDTLSLFRNGFIRDYSIDYINSINEIIFPLYSIEIDNECFYYVLKNMPMVSSTGKIKDYQIINYHDGLLITISKYY